MTMMMFGRGVSGAACPDAATTAPLNSVMVIANAARVSAARRFPIWTPSFVADQPRTDGPPAGRDVAGHRSLRKSPGDGGKRSDAAAGRTTRPLAAIVRSVKSCAGGL